MAAKAGRGKTMRVARKRGELIERALKRKDALKAADSLLDLAPAERAEWLPQVARAVRGAVASAHRGRTWADLAALAIRAESEPGLVESAAGPDDAAAAWWPLVWACGRANDWRRARVLWLRLEPAVRLGNAPLADAMGAWVTTADSAQGRASKGARGTLPPDSTARVREAMIALRASLPWHEFAGATERWLARSSAEVDGAIRLEAGRLAAREIAERLASGRPPAEPVRFLAQLVQESVALPDLEAEVLLGVRALWSAIAVPGLSDAGQAQALVRIGKAAARYASLRAFLEGAVLNLAIHPPAAEKFLALLETLLADACVPGLGIKALRVWDVAFRYRTDRTGDCQCAGCREEAGPPGWLRSALERSIASGELASWLARAPVVLGGGALGLMSDWLDAASCLALFDQAWEASAGTFRTELGQFATQAIRNQQERQTSRSDHDGFFEDPDDDPSGFGALDGVGEALRRSFGLSAPKDHPLYAEGAARKLWDRVAERLIPEGGVFVEAALINAGSARKRRELAERMLEQVEAEPARTIAVLAAVDRAGDFDLCLDLGLEQFQRLAGDARACAAALEAAVARPDFPFAMMVNLAQRLLAAVPRKSKDLDPAIARMIDEARLLVREWAERHPASTLAPKKKRQPAKRKSSPRPAGRRKVGSPSAEVPAGQLGLPGIVADD